MLQRAGAHAGTLKRLDLCNMKTDNIGSLQHEKRTEDQASVATFGKHMGGCMVWPFHHHDPGGFEGTCDGQDVMHVHILMCLQA